MCHAKHTFEFFSEPRKIIVNQKLFRRTKWAGYPNQKLKLKQQTHHFKVMLVEHEEQN